MRALALALALGPVAVYAQPTTSLPELRGQLETLYTQLDDLRDLMAPAGVAQPPRFSGGPLERLGSIEGELRRLTAKIEELEYRVDRMVRDGTARIGDLDYRLCSLETGCSPAQLSAPQPLGGADAAPTGPRPQATNTGPTVGAAERVLFDGARLALEAGDYEAAAKGFADHLAQFPGGPLTAESELLRGQARQRMADLPGAARAYLAAFSADASGPFAPAALNELGRTLGALGQTNEACVTLTEVATRFPQSRAVSDAAAAKTQLGCP